MSNHSTKIEKRENMKDRLSLTDMLRILFPEHLCSLVQTQPKIRFEQVMDRWMVEKYRNMSP